MAVAFQSLRNGLRVGVPLRVLERDRALLKDERARQDADRRNRPGARSR